MKLLENLPRHGLPRLAHKTLIRLDKVSDFTTWRYRQAPGYANPTAAELAKIEQDLIALNVDVRSPTPSPEEFRKFQAGQWFPSDYRGGLREDVWRKKLIEDWISSQRLNLMSHAPHEIYVDVAATGSPWACALRTRKGITAKTIDLKEFHTADKDLPCHLILEIER